MRTQIPLKILEHGRAYRVMCHNQLENEHKLELDKAFYIGATEKSSVKYLLLVRSDKGHPAVYSIHGDLSVEDLEICVRFPPRKKMISEKEKSLARQILERLERRENESS